MKRLWRFFGTARRNGKRLIALCYAVFLVGSLLLVLFGVVEDGVRRWTGDVQYIEIPGDREDAFRLHDLEQDGMWYTSVSIDPRMDLDLSLVSPAGSAIYVRSVTLYMEELNKDPGEVCVFYKPYPGMDEYDAIFRVWANKNEQNVYSFTLPICEMYGIRIDPGIFSGMHYRLDRVVLNEPRSLLDRLTPTRPYLLALAVVPLLAASVLHWIFCAQDIWTKKRNAKKQQAGDNKTCQGKSEGLADGIKSAKQQTGTEKSDGIVPEP